MKINKQIGAILACLLILPLAGLVGTASAQKPRTAGTKAKKALPRAVRPSDDSLTMIRRKNTLDVGLSTFVPWAMHDKNGNLIGFEVEVAKKLADDLGVELKLHPVGFSEIIGDLNNNRFDIIVSGIYPTPQRAIFVNFSDYYSESKIEFVASRVNMKRADDRKDFDKPGVTIGVVAGTVYESFASDNFPNATIKKFSAEEDLYEEIVNGTIAGGIASTPGPEILAKTNKDKVYMPFGALGKLGESFAIRRGDMDFLNYLNTWIKFHEQIGWLKNERKKWFDSTDWMDQL